MVITLTGTTGTIGRHLLALFEKEAIPVRALVRDIRKAPPVRSAVFCQVDLRREDLLPVALKGTDVLFLLTGNEPGFSRLQMAVAREARKAGVQHVVKLSALGASDHTRSSIAREHWEAEEAIRGEGLSWTFLRPHAFMQNWLSDLAREVREEGVIRSPIGDGKVPFIDARDIAEVAFRILLDPEPHRGKKYFLTGGKAVGYKDVAETLEKLLKRPVRYQPISLEEERKRLQMRGLPPELIEGLLTIAEYQRAGGPTAQVSPHVERLLGRPPRSLEAFLRDHLDAFR
ncbi:MAG: SDR family oxidoreductase [Clostridiales bacterium]|nr:SDR family oxidoreductase [Clostridiales bacterium]